MSHEIYYTSAPEGLKRGSSGFSTVGATEGIPKALWDRLEALSAYRHHFGVAAAEGGGGSGPNPVSYAHWLLNVTGTTYHVLSRVCDSGVDHTQRSNAFAHHLVLDAAERAAAGPAWMLEQSGVMESGWNGKVEAIARRSGLPQGDSQGGVCREWASVTGDAGWGGVLADLFVRSPGKPVCLLFSPGQEVLPLIAETIALLPVAARWNVTFNTYFTSMPTSATCLWRCCLAGTPAAQVGLRYAAGGIVIDLTDRARLGAIVEGPYVTMARTGVAPAAAGSVGTAAGARAAVGKAPPKSIPNAPKIPIPAIPPDDEEEELGAYDFADDIQELNEEIDSAAKAEIKGPPPSKGIKLPRAIPEIVIPRPKERKRAGIRAVDAGMRTAEGEAAKAAAHRRRQIVWMFFGALGAIAVGTGLVLLAELNSAPPELPPVQRQSITVLQTPVPIMPSPQINPEMTGVTTAPVMPVFVTTRPVMPEPARAIPVIQNPVTPAPPRFPATLTLATIMSPPKSGGGIADSSQSLAFPAGTFDSSARTTGMRVRFPATAAESTAEITNPGDYSEWAYKDGFEGTMTEEAARAASSSGGAGPVTLSWKDANGTMDVVSLALDQSNAKKPVVNVIWKAGALVKRPEVVNLAYWLLQSSTLETRHGSGGAESSQQISFKRSPSQVVDITSETAALSFQADLPKDFVVVAPAAGDGSGLPAGWEATWYTDWDEKDAALRTADNAAQVVKFRKGTSNGDVDAWFLLRFGPGLKSVTSTFSKSRSDVQEQADTSAQDLEKTTAQITSLKRQFGSSYDSSDTAKELAKKKADATSQIDAYKEALAGYNELKDIDVTIGLPGGLHIATIRFHRSEKPDTNQGQ